MKKKNQRHLPFIMAIAVCVVLITAIGMLFMYDDLSKKGGIDNNPKLHGEVTYITSPEELKELLVEQRYYSVGPRVLAESAAVDDGGNMDKSSSHSETNVQVPGIDEPDFVKTDGDFIYVISKGSLLAINKFEDNVSMEIDRELEIDGRAQSIYITDERIIVMTQRETKRVGLHENTFLPHIQYIPQTVFVVIDKETFELIDELAVSGYHFQSRLINDTVFFVTKEYMYYGDPHLPMVRDSGEEKTVRVGYIVPPEQTSTLHVVGSFDITTGDINEVEGMLLEDTYTAYMSTNALYIASLPTSRGYDDLLFEEVILPLFPEHVQEEISELLDINEKNDHDAIEEIFVNYISNLEEKEREKLFELMDKKIRAAQQDYYNQRDVTLIFKYDRNEGILEYSGQGQVDGRLIGQFALDEYDGYLRVASTLNRYNGEEWLRNNKVTIFDEEMNEVSNVDELANGERIFSARYKQDRLYLVTFKDIDPLFVIDLDPEKPKVISELKIPGVSRYLHMINATTLVGVGDHIVEENGRAQRKGVKISLFDITDEQNVVEKVVTILGDASSTTPITYNHHAFQMYADYSALFIPLRTTTYEPLSSRYHTKAPMIVLDSTNLEEIATIEHEMERESGYYHSGIQRSLYVDEITYFVSNGLISAHDSDNEFAQVDSIRI